jgi:hypothetical protein
MEQLQQANIAAMGATLGTVAIDTAAWGWCCTHSLMQNMTLASQMCTKPCGGHKHEVALADPMGGSDKINFGNPRHNCHNRARHNSPANASANLATTDITQSGRHRGGAQDRIQLPLPSRPATRGLSAFFFCFSLCLQMRFCASFLLPSSSSQSLVLLCVALGTHCQGRLVGFGGRSFLPSRQVPADLSSVRRPGAWQAFGWVGCCACECVAAKQPT